MTPTSPRDERRRAILDATRTLATEHGADGFTVDQVAALAGVSRRTVFNHVAGIDQLLVAVCEQILAEVTAELLEAVDRETVDLPPGDAGSRAALTAVCEAARGVDLPTAIATISRVLGGPGAADERTDAISRTALEHVGERLSERLHDRAPALDPFDLDLTLVLLTNGIAALAARWVCDHPDLAPDVSPGARADWVRLLERLLDRLLHGLAG